MSEHPICDVCKEPIESPDEIVRMARQVDVTGFNPSGQRKWTDGRVSAFHEWHAPPSQLGVWRRIS